MRNIHQTNYEIMIKCIIFFFFIFSFTKTVSQIEEAKREKFQLGYRTNLAHTDVVSFISRNSFERSRCRRNKRVKGISGVKRYRKISEKDLS